MQNIYQKYVERGSRPAFHPERLTPFTKLHKSLFSLASSDDYIRDMRINSGLNELLVLLMNESWHPAAHADTALNKQNLDPIRDYLYAHYTERISLDALTDQFFISKFYLTRVFKEQFGVSINTYLLNLRITKAKQLLRFTDKKLEDIGYQCGLGAPHYFSRIFKQVEGITPFGGPRKVVNLSLLGKDRRKMTAFFQKKAILCKKSQAKGKKKTFVFLFYSLK